MNKSANSPETLFAVVMWVISLAIASFLIGLGGNVIRDLPLVEKPLSIEDFQDKSKMDQLVSRQEVLRREDFDLRQQREQAKLAANHARAAYGSEHQSFRNWLATRGVTEDQTQNPEVVSRTNKLEEMSHAQRAAELECERLDLVILKNSQELATAERSLNDQRDLARKPFESAVRWQSLKIFLIRLLFTLPLLVAGVAAFRTQRKSRYWPLWRGFILFTLYCFFFELVPYLPSYGGYVRYGVGIVLTILAGHYAVRWMQAYLSRRRELQKQAEETRRGAMDRDQALARISANLCPSCERPIQQVAGLPSTFCVFCGLNLFSQCVSCGTRMNSFFTHCGQCGKPIGRGAPVAADVPPVLGADTRPS
jgi:hypothetical protein